MTSLMISQDLLHIMAWCLAAPSHYVKQCWTILWNHMASVSHNELTVVDGCVIQMIHIQSTKGCRIELNVKVLNRRLTCINLRIFGQQYTSNVTSPFTERSRPHSYIYGLVQERRNSKALAMELWLSCINPSISNQIGLIPNGGHFVKQEMSWGSWWLGNKSNPTSVLVWLHQKGLGYLETGSIITQKVQT